MNQAIAYDTHKSFKRLLKAGADEALAEAIIDCQSGSQSELATKADIAKLEADIVRLEASTKENIAGLEVRLTNRMYGLAIGIVASQTALTVALIKLLP